MSGAPRSASRSVFRKDAEASSAATASCRAPIGSASASGQARRDASSRPPAAVTVRSTAPSRQSRASPRSLRRISRLRRVAASMCSTPRAAARHRAGEVRQRLGAAALRRLDVVERHRRRRDLGRGVGPESLQGGRRRRRRRPARRRRAAAPLPSPAPRPARAATAARSGGARSSAGSSRARRPGRSAAAGSDSVSKAPVETSSQAAPTAPASPGASASSHAGRAASSSASSVTVPGVTSRTTSRRRVGALRFLASSGVSICSQIATRKPRRISRAR